MPKSLGVVVAADSRSPAGSSLGVDTGLLREINPSAHQFAADLETRISDRDRASWERGSIEDWVLEGHRLARTVAYGDLDSESPPVVGAAYKRRVDIVVEEQLEKGGVRLGYLLDRSLK